jgi:hypothetical protein
MGDEVPPRPDGEPGSLDRATLERRYMHQRRRIWALQRRLSEAEATLYRLEAILKEWWTRREG